MQLFGIFALVASLIFVGFQIKQAQEIAESNAYQARATTSIEFSAMRASSPAFISAQAKIYNGQLEELSGEEKVALEYFFGGEMTMYENLHFQYVLGYLPREHWEKNVAEIRCTLSLPLYRELVKYYQWRKSFQDVVDQIVAKVATDPSNCWE
jgi:hypothetical protein